MAEKRIMTVQLLPTGEFQIDYEDNDTVQYLKNRICHVPELEGQDYDSRFIKLLCDGNVLENEQLLKDCEITNESTILLVKQKHGKINPQKRKDLSLLSGKGLFDTVWSLDSFNDPFGMSPFNKNRMLESTIKPHTLRNQEPFLEAHGPRQRDPLMSSMSSFRSNDFKDAGTASFGGDFNATNFQANASSTSTLETDFSSSLTIKDDESNPSISTHDANTLTKFPPPKFPSIESKLPDLTSTFPSMNTNFPTIGMNFPAMGTNFPATGTNFPAMGTNFPAMGTNFPAMGTNFPAMGTNFPAMGTQFPGSATNLPNFNPSSIRPPGAGPSGRKPKKKRITESSVQSLIEMGYTAKQSKTALKLSNNDLQMAIEMLVTGAVPSTEPELPKPIPVQSGRKVKVSIIKKAVDDHPTSDISSESESELESESETEGSAFNNSVPTVSNSQMREFVQRLRNDPQQLQSVKSTLISQNPQLAQMIDTNPEQFFNILEQYGSADNAFGVGSSGFGGGASGFGASASGFGGGATGFGGGASGFGGGASDFGVGRRSNFGNDFTPRGSSDRDTNANQRPDGSGEVRFTPSQNEKISNIEAMGFEREKVIEAFLLCDRDEETTVSYLLSSAT